MLHNSVEQHAALQALSLLRIICFMLYNIVNVFDPGMIFIQTSLIVYLFALLFPDQKYSVPLVPYQPMLLVPVEKHH